MQRFRGSFVAVALILLAGVVSVVAQSGRSSARSQAKPYTTWTAYGGGPHSSQFTALSQIKRSPPVSRTRPASWSRWIAS